MLVSRLLSVIGYSALLLGCGLGTSSKEKRLAKDKASLQSRLTDLQAQIDALGPDGAGLKEIQSKLQDTSRALEDSLNLQNALSQEKAELEQDIEALSSTEPGAKILELRRALREKEGLLLAEIDNSKKLVAEKDYYDTLIKATLEPFWGLYISKGPLLNVGTSNCRMFIYPKNDGQLIRALVCRDGKIQWEKQQMLTFDATVDDNLEGKYGFGVRAQNIENSCTRAPSYLASSGDYHFERASRYGNAEFSVGLRTDLGSQPLLLENAAVNFQSSDCEDLMARATTPGNLSGELLENLDLAAKFCRFINGEAPFLVGCFAEGNTFVPYY